jgi:predicted RND superfamily exporter protein
MQRLGQLIADRRIAGAIVALVLVFTATCGFLATRLTYDHDVQAFLPWDRAELVTSQEVAARFGTANLAFVGIETQDVFEPAFLERLKTTTAAVQGVPGVTDVLSLMTLKQQVHPQHGAPSIRLVVQEVPKDTAGRAALRSEVLAQDAIVGALVNEAGTATVLYFTVEPGDGTVAAELRRTVESGLSQDDLTWGGNAFARSWTKRANQTDLNRLTPAIFLVILSILLVACRDPLMAVAGLIASVSGALAAKAGLAVLGIPLNSSLGAMPVLILAFGSAYSIPLMVRYQDHAANASPAEAAQSTLTLTGPAVLTTGTAMVIALASLGLSELAPIRTLGLASAFGLAVTVCITLVLVPSVAVLASLSGRSRPLPGLPKGLIKAVIGIHLYRPTFAIILGLLVLAGIGFAARLDHRLDPTVLNRSDSPPILAQAFLSEQLGRSPQVVIQVEGPLSDPHVLREVQRLAAEISRLNSVIHVGDAAQVVSQLNRTRNDTHRIPDTQDEVSALLDGAPHLGIPQPLIGANRRHGLMRITLDADDKDEVDKAMVEIAKAVARSPTRLSVLSAGAVGATARRSLLVVTQMAALAPSAPPDALTQALDSVSDPRQAPGEKSPATLDLVKTQAKALSLALGLVPRPGLDSKLAGVILDASAPTVGVPDPGGELALAWTLTGQQVIFGALSASNTGGLYRSLGFTALMVFGLLCWYFRDIRAGLISLIPAAIALAIVYGLLGATGFALDIGTAALGALTLGAGVNAAVHFQSNWVAGVYEPLENAAGRAASRTGKLIWAQTLIVVGGLSLLAFTQTRPLRHLGALAASAVFIAAALTWVAIPVLANRKRYDPRTLAQEPADPLFDQGVG